MTDTAFSDSYIETDAELETLIGSDPRAAAVTLKALAAASQAWYCQEATRHIDQLPLRGIKYDYDQGLEFPRIIDGVIVGDEDQIAVVPDGVKRACLEEAIAIYALNSDSDRTDRETMKADGVKSYNLGGVYSETLGASTSDRQCGLISTVAARLMRRYVGLEVR